MKIALISPLPPPEGGIATWTKEVEKYFVKKDIPVEIINNAVVGRRKQQITSKTRVMDEVVRTKAIIGMLVKTIKNFQPDILHINTSCGRFGIFRDFICILIAQKNRIPCILHCHCNVVDQLNSTLAIQTFRQMVRMSKVVLVLNKTTLNYVNSCVDGKAILMPNFIETDKIECYDKILNDKIKEILFVGHIQKTKGCYEIIETAKHCPNINFTLIGPIGEEFKSVKLPKNLKMLGKKRHDELNAYMERADIFLFPSYTEGFSNALLEAMNNGLPIIASNVGANEDMIEEGGGIIVPSQNIEKIVEAIAVLENPQIRRDMSKWNIKKVERFYSKENVMSKMIEIYQNILNE